MNITSLIFDGSGVITDERPRDTAKMWSKKYNIPYKDIWQTVYLDNYYLARDGKLSAFEYYKNSVDILKMQISYEEFVKDYIADCSVRPEMIKILAKLSTKIPLYLFSNQTEINVTYLRPLLELYFRYMIFSNEVKMHKPDKKIYELLLKHMESGPSDSLYVDDLIEPLSEAKKFGIPTYHFKTVEQFEKDLRLFQLIN